MKKIILSSAIFVMALTGFAVNQAVALPWTEAEVGSDVAEIVLDDGYSWSAIDYWTTSDLTSGVNGENILGITKEDASYESVFGFYTVDNVADPHSVATYFPIFAKTDEVGKFKTILFQQTATGWQIKLNNVGVWVEFDRSFGFYYDVYQGGDDDTTVDYVWHTDKQFNKTGDGDSSDTDIEHVIVAYSPVEVGNGGTVNVYLDDQPGNGDKDFTDMTVLVNDVSPVPEPASMLLFGAGLVGLAGISRRFKK